MKDLLVGSTGFVGSNLRMSHDFDGLCHSTDIADYYGAKPELCIYAGVPAAMYLANTNPSADLEIIKQARKNIRKINPKKLILVSTIAVYSNLSGVDENTVMDEIGLPAYGRNRLKLENWAREDYADVVIIRLPALYGEGLKKNFLYDLHTIIPFELTAEKYEQLKSKNEIVKRSYKIVENGYYRFDGNADKDELKAFFEHNDFNAISFTNSRSEYQFYKLSRLWDDICKVIDTGINLINLTTPPIKAKEVYYRVMDGVRWENDLVEQVRYDVKSVHSDVVGGSDGYVCSRKEEIEDICLFMRSWRKNDK